jgi:hypothetical protein
MIQKLTALEDGQIVRRYMSLGKFLDVLERRRLFFSAMSGFSDKLEGRLTPVDDFFLSGGDQILSNVVHNLWPAAVQNDAHSKVASERAKRFQEEFDRRTISTVFGEIRPTKENTAKDIISKQKNWLDVNCWDKNASESIAMWKIYGGVENSVCIHTTVADLIGALSIPNHLEAYIGEVEYSLHKDGYYEGASPLGYFMRKHPAYEYEKEVRILIHGKQADPLSTRHEKGTFIPVDLNRLINGVTVSPEAPDWFFELIANWISKTYGLSASVLISDLDNL